MAATIDAKNIFLKDVDTASSVTSSVLDLGVGTNLTPLYIDVKLTKAVTAGNVATVTVQSSTTAAFNTAITEMVVTVHPSATAQAAGPCQLAQFFCPITPGGRYARLIVAGPTGDGAVAPANGKLWAYMSPDIQAP